MTNRLPMCALAVAAMLSSPAHAVYKCTSNDNQVVYQDKPCATGTEALVNIVLPPPVESTRVSSQKSQSAQPTSQKSRVRPEPDATGDGLVAVPVSTKVSDKGKDQPSGPRWSPETPNIPVQTPCNATAACALSRAARP